MMGSELARQGLRPTRVFSDGTALPSSFGSVRETYELGRADSAFAPSMDTDRQTNDGRVAGQKTSAVPGKTPNPGPSPVRAEIQRAHGHLQGQTTGAVGNFDAKAEIIKTPDGTLKSRKSLFEQSGKQVIGDADVTLDAAKDAVKSLLKRDK